MKVLPASVWLVASCLAHAALAALPASSPIVQWINLLQSEVKSIPNIQNQVGPKLYGLQAQAIWEALKVNRGGSRDGLPKFNETAVIAYASHTLLTHSLPWWSYRHDLLIQAQLAGLDQVQLNGAQKIGEAVANKILADRVNDGFARWANYKPYPLNATSSIGKYQFATGQTFALYPQYGLSKPCLLKNVEIDSIANDYVNRFQGYFQSEEWYADLNYTRTLGSTASTARTPYDNDTPLFWAGMPGTSLMHGQFINIAISVLPDDYPLWDQARFFALFGATINDASQACFRVKYLVEFWRPHTAINFGDGTNRYAPDPTWTPYLAVPPHPAYPSGHQCLSGAAVAAIVRELGTSKASFTVTSDSLPGQLRSFTDVTDVLKETTISRIFGGLHLRRENTDGLDLGRDVFNVISKKFE